MTAKYEVVAGRLRDEITSGRRRPGEMLESEHDLAAAYAVSRATVRRALDQLNREGLVRAEKGRGSFVANASPMSRFFSLSTFDDDMRRLHRTPSTELLAAEVVAADAAAARRLAVPRGTELLHVRRLRRADGDPVALEDRLLPRELCPDLLDEDLVHHSLHWLLTAKHRIPLVRLEQVVELRPLTADEAVTLHAEPGAAAYAIDRLTSTADPDGAPRPAVWFRAVHRHDTYDA